MLMMFSDVSSVFSTIYEVFEVCDDCAHASAGAHDAGYTWDYISWVL